MKQVIRTVLREMDLRPVKPRSERPVRNAIAFVPHKHALVIATPQATPGSEDTRRGVISQRRSAA